MNISELARRLRINPVELREKLPQLGFDIGQKAIKIDDRAANKIIQSWPSLLRRLRENSSVTGERQERAQNEEKKKLRLPGHITVRDFAELAGLPVSRVLAQLMKSGIFISLNEEIDYDTAAIIGSDLGLEIEKGEEEEKETLNEKVSVDDVMKSETAENLKPRPPVIVVMGHVDHGKTKLLDAIRRTNVVEKEAGGITQHIGAYQVERRNRFISFIDTPGHEAFTAMRSRGAKVADIAILVVAADDGVMPQTTEAFQIIKAAGTPFVVAINKIDKPDADINKTKQELSTKLNITPEDWGGKTVTVPVSAKDGTGIEELLDIILLTADLDAEKIKANPGAPALGTIIESHIDKGEGPVATILIQNGTLKIGDALIRDGIMFGKVRALKNYLGENVSAAAPSTPVKIIGLKIAPEVGDVLAVGVGRRVDMRSLRMPKRTRIEKEKVSEGAETQKTINIIIKSDVLGSAEAIDESLEKISNPEVKIVTITKGLGNISESDITRASATNAQIIGFNVKVSSGLEELARTKNVKITLYSIIYNLINDVKSQMEDLFEPEIRRTDLGKLKVLASFKIEKTYQVIGGKVLSGKIEKGALIEVIRGDEMKTKGKLASLQIQKQEVPDCSEGQECGIKFEGEPVIEPGDILQFYKEEKIKKKF
ncbi:MAG: translation initiation factor IF-2 [Patescibacteria group bacterium]|jgi:translation initiation factor IF-2